MNEVVGYCGQQVQVQHILTPGEAATLTGLAAAVVNEADGLATGLAAPTATDGGAGQESFSYRVFLTWTPPATPLDALYRLAGTVNLTAGGSAPFLLRGRILVWPTWSHLDRYVARVQGWLQDTAEGDQQRLSLRDYRDALGTAVREYEKDRPREVVTHYDLDGATLEYPLPDATAEDLDGEVFDPPAPWVNQFSRFLGLTFPQDYTRLTPLSPEPRPQIDWRRGVWRFQYVYPPLPTGVDVAYTTRHTLSHTADSLPPDDFEAITQFASGVLLAGPLANKASGTEAQGEGVGLVSYRDQQLRYRQQGQDAKQAARALWQVESDTEERRQGPTTLCLTPTAGGRARRSEWQIANYGE